MSDDLHRGDVDAEVLHLLEKNRKERPPSAAVPIGTATRLPSRSVALVLSMPSRSGDDAVVVLGVA